MWLKSVISVSTSNHSLGLDTNVGLPARPSAMLISALSKQSGIQFQSSRFDMNLSVSGALLRALSWFLMYGILPPIARSEPSFADAAPAGARSFNPKQK